MAHYTPPLIDPYPAAYAGEKIENFLFVTPLVLRREIEAIDMGLRQRDADYIVASDYKVSFTLKGETRTRTITVPRGMLTDLSSVPQALQSIVSRVGPHLEASIVHDFLYVAWQDLEDNGQPRGARDADRNFADAVMRAAMVKSQVPRDQRNLIMFALGAAGWEVYRKENPHPRYYKFW